MYIVGIDIGGTFTDIALMNEKSKKIFSCKVPSTPKDLSIGVINALEKVKKRYGVHPSDVSRLVHATTIATNAILERKICRTGLITTKGFRDILEMKRQIRTKLYDLFQDKPEPLIPRNLRLEITERVGSRGEVVTELNEPEVIEAVKKLKGNGVESIAVCFLFSFINSIHERKTLEIIKEKYPEAFVSISSEICPEFREYERTSTTVLNAAVMPVVSEYLNRLENKFITSGIKAALHIMQSSGGVITFREARVKPVSIIESGPAAGVIAATYIGKAIGCPNIITLDIGGTTSKAALVEGGEAAITTDYDVGGITHGGRFIKGSGYVLKAPMIDLVEVSAGGGSIAWVDPGGMLRIGPQSAGAEPGPACYGKGGTEPTITDAAVILGYINPDYFLGGEMKIKAELADNVIKQKIADPLGMDLVEAANGIVTVDNSNVTKALRMVSVERGHDPRNFTMIAFGGAGPMYAGELAKELSIPKVIVPLNPGCTSAYGLLATDIKIHRVMTYVINADEIHIDKLNNFYLELEQQIVEDLKTCGIPKNRMVLYRSSDMRYLGQQYELMLPIPSGKIEEISRIIETFHSKHQRTYGYSDPDGTVEFVNYRVVGVGIVPKLHLKRYKRSFHAQPKETLRRKVFFKEFVDYTDCPIYRRNRLRVGNTINGPAIIEEVDSTIVILPDQRGEVDEYGNIVIWVL